MNDVIDVKNNLNLGIHYNFLSSSEEKELFDIVKKLPWYRVAYESERHKSNCITPCYTNFFGGFEDVKPYQPIPECLYNIINKVSKATNAHYNAILLRLYFDKDDNIAWHTDGRTFLGKTPIIASLSLGGKCKFLMKKMTNVWPCKETPNNGNDLTVPQLEYTLNGGDLLVMRDKTQQSWHHKVPKENRTPRININFRYILPHKDEISIRGVQTFYKYMVSGDSKTEDWEITAKPLKYSDINKNKKTIFSSFGFGKSSSSSSSNSTCNISSSNISNNSESKIDKIQDKQSSNDNINNNNNDTWECSTCTLLNFNKKTLCEACGESKIKLILPTTNKKRKQEDNTISSIKSFLKRNDDNTMNKLNMFNK
jgi:alkylated DNA repair dioxygenase AlkB